MKSIAHLKKQKVVFASLVMALGLFLSANAQATTIDFSGLSNGTAVTNQYAGVVFSLQGFPDSAGPPTTYNYAGEGLANSTNPDYPTANILDIAFTAPVSGVSFTFNNFGGAATTYTAFNAGSAVVDTGSLQGVENFSLVNVAGSGITDLQLDNNSGNTNWYFAIQQLTFTPADLTPTPLPATWTMMLAAMVLFSVAAYRRKKRAVVVKRG